MHLFSFVIQKKNEETNPHLFPLFNFDKTIAWKTLHINSVNHLSGVHYVFTFHYAFSVGNLSGAAV